jgi:hypothetical protein
MGLIVDPHKSEFVEISGVHVEIRPLTSSEIIPLLPALAAMPEQGQLDIKTVHYIVMRCLVGWDQADVPFDVDNKRANVDHFEVMDLIALVNKILSISRLSADQEKN